MTGLQQVAEKILVIAQVIAVIAKRLLLKKNAPKHSVFRIRAFISR